MTSGDQIGVFIDKDRATTDQDLVIVKSAEMPDEERIGSIAGDEGGIYPDKDGNFYFSRGMYPTS